MTENFDRGVIGHALGYVLDHEIRDAADAALDRIAEAAEQLAGIHRRGPSRHFPRIGECSTCGTVWPCESDSYVQRILDACSPEPSA